MTTVNSTRAAGRPCFKCFPARANGSERKFTTGIDLARSTMTSFPFNCRPSLFVGSRAENGEELYPSALRFEVFNHALTPRNGMETAVQPAFATEEGHGRKGIAGLRNSAVAERL
jgi:hypothetical protein